MNDAALVIYIPVWGARHLDMLERYTLPSVARSLRAAGLKAIRVLLCTTSDDADHAEAIVRDGLLELPVEVERIVDHKHALNRAVRFAYEFGTRMLCFPPDVCFGAGSIETMLAVSARRDVVVAAAHLRVDSEAFFAAHPDGFRGGSCADLVDLAFRFPHLATSSSWCCDNDSSTLVGGISLTRLDANRVAMLHFMPAPYLARFREEDLLFFDGNRFDAWDHDWPAILVSQRRYRMLACSDLAFGVEFTEPDRNTIPAFPGTIWSERFRRQGSHHDAGAATTILLRGSAG